MRGLGLVCEETIDIFSSKGKLDEIAVYELISKCSSFGLGHICKYKSYWSCSLRSLCLELSLEVLTFTRLIAAFIFLDYF